MGMFVLARASPFVETFNFIGDSGDVRMTTGTFLARGVSPFVVRVSDKYHPVTLGDAPFAKELPPMSPSGLQ